MVSRILVAGFAAVFVVGSAFAQTPAPPAPNTISAEATDTLRAAPDVARVTFSVVTKNAIAETATDENETLSKDFLANIGKLKLNGVKITAQTVKVAKVESQDPDAGKPAGAPMTKADYRVVRAITVTVKDADTELLQAAVSKVQKEGAKIGVAGDSTQNIYTGLGNEMHNKVKVVYGLQAGWDDRSKDVLAKLTKKALERATALAEGAGLKVAGVLSVEEPADAAHMNPFASWAANIYGTAEPTDELVDGELVQKVRVRVTVRVLEK